MSEGEERLVLGVTYEEARKRGRAKSWSQRIKEAYANSDSFTAEDVQLAGSWVTCACGERDDILFEDAAPADSLLYRLGLRFLYAVQDDKPEDAEELLERIQVRACELLTAGLGPKEKEQDEEKEEE